MSSSLDVSSTNADISSDIADGQALLPYAAVGARIRKRADELGLKAADLCRLTDIKPQTMSGYWKGDRPVPSDKVFAISDALKCSARWLIAGVHEGTHLQAVDAADWVDVPEHDIRDLTDENRGPVVSTTPIRKDWLNQTFGTAKGLWLARLPADLPRYRLNEGDLVFLRDLAPGEAQDGAIYIVRVWGHLTVARLDTFMSNQMRSVEANIEDRVLAPRDIGTEDGKAILVARVLGAPLRRL